MDFADIGLLISLSTLAILIYIVIRHIKRFNKSFENTKEYMYYDESDKTLFVQKRHPDLYNLLSARNFTIDYYGHKQEKLVYTSVTVGGVTTGGVHKTGGDYVQRDVFSGRFDLIYLPAVKDANSGAEIFEIILSEELRLEAEESPIAEYLSNGSIIVVEENDEPSYASTAAWLAGNENLSYNLDEQHKAMKHPTREKCEQIKNWLSMR